MMSVDFCERVGCSPTEYLGNAFKKHLAPISPQLPPLTIVLLTGYILSGRIRELSSAAKWGLGFGAPLGGFLLSSPSGRVTVRAATSKANKDSAVEWVQLWWRTEDGKLNKGMLLFPVSFLLLKASPLHFPRLSWIASRGTGFYCGVESASLLSPAVLLWFDAKEDKEADQALPKRLETLLETHDLLGKKSRLSELQASVIELRIYFKTGGVGPEFNRTAQFHQLVKKLGKQMNNQRIGNSTDTPQVRMTAAKKAYHAYALTSHPDKGGNTESFQDVDSLYKLIVKFYDNELKADSPESSRDVD